MFHFRQELEWGVLYFWQHSLLKIIPFSLLIGLGWIESALNPPGLESVVVVGWERVWNPWNSNKISFFTHPIVWGCAESPWQLMLIF